MARQGSSHEHWSRFRERGYITTFGVATPNNYGPAIRKFWCTQFGALDTGAVILDVAAGNGAIAVMAAEYSAEHGKDFTVMAAAAAVIHKDPEDASQALEKYRNSIDFYGETTCENLPFENGSIDLICSQYGIEYSVLAESLAEAARVPKTGGEFRAIMHHSASQLPREGHQELSMLTDAMNQHRVFEKLDHYFSLVGHPGNLIDLNNAQQDTAAMQAASSLMNSLAELIKTYPQSPVANRIVKGINNILVANVTRPDEERKAAITSAYSYFLMSIERIRDLEAAAISPQMMEKVKAAAQGLGLAQFAYAEVRSTGGNIVGWQVYARKEPQ